MDKERFKVPKSVQQAIPIQRIWPDGIFQQGTKFSKTYRLSLIHILFVGRDRNGTPRYAHVRGTADTFRQDITGSDKSYPFRYEGNSCLLYTSMPEICCKGFLICLLKMMKKRISWSSCQREKTVSYTHLDVYKRQTHSLSITTPS